MSSTIKKEELRNRLLDIIESGPAILSALGDNAKLPKDLADWLTRLRILYGVPINYLVPDEAMLPPESIRFFSLDINWVDALIDGAYSIGRNLANPKNNNAFDYKIDRATFNGSRLQIDQGVTAIRAKKLGVSPASVDLLKVTGFLLRSKIVSDYPGFGVNAYEWGHTPNDGADVKLMNILRFERLGDHADTLICLLAGEVYRADIHEAPQHLHYSMTTYQNDGVHITSTKLIWPFDKSGDNKVTLGKNQVSMDDAGDYFRTVDARTVQAARLAAGIKKKLDKVDFDAADFGFEMVEGVGMVQFKYTGTPTR